MVVSVVCLFFLFLLDHIYGGSMADPLVCASVSRTLSSEHAVHGVCVLVAHPYLPLVAMGNEAGLVQVWDTDSGLILHTLREHTQKILCLHFDSAGGRLISAGKDGTACLWDVDTGTCARVLRGHNSWVWAATSNATSTHIATAARNKTIAIWDTVFGSLEDIITVPIHEIVSLASHPTDDYLAAGSSEGPIYVLRWSTCSLVRVFNEHRGAVYSLAASAAWLVSIATDNTVRVRLWTTNNAGADPGAHTLRKCKRDVVPDSLGWKGSTLIVSEETPALDCVVHVWDTSEADPRHWTRAIATIRTLPCDGAALIDERHIVCAAPRDTTPKVVWRLWS